MRFELSPRADADLCGIADWYDRDDPAHGAELLRELRLSFRQIAQTPLASPMTRTRRRGLRGRVVGPYVIYYRVAGETVLIERVLHGRQRRPRLP